MIEFTDNYFLEIIDQYAYQDDWQQYWLPKNDFPIVGVQVQSFFETLGLMWTSTWTWLALAWTATWTWLALAWTATWTWTIEFTSYSIVFTYNSAYYSVLILPWLAFFVPAATFILGNAFLTIFGL